MQSIFAFSSFRVFLSDYAAQTRKAKAHWSLGRWRRDLGLSNTASLSRILSGVRSPSPELTERFCCYFGFNARERLYFQNLVLLERVKPGDSLKTLVMEKLQTLHPKKTFELLDHHTFAVIANWHFYPIREMTTLHEFREDPHWIAQRLQFRVTPKQARDALAKLTQLGLLTRDPRTGRLRPAQANLETTNDVASEAHKRNHEQNIENAKLALRQVPIELREFNAVCLNLAPDKITRAKALIREFKARFIEEIEAEPGAGQSTCQLQIHFFPFTKPVKPQPKEKKHVPRQQNSKRSAPRHLARSGARDVSLPQTHSRART